MSILLKSNILLLEDDIEFASFMIETLELYFSKVYHATNIQEALTLLQEQKINVIMSDINLKKENGLDFIQTLKNKNIEKPTIIISGFDAKEYLFKAIKLNVVDYLLKPIDLDQLEAVLNKCELVLKSSTSNNIYYLKEDIYFNMDKKVIYDNEKEIPLTSREYLFLELSVKNKGYVLTRDMIEDAVYSNEEMSAAALKNLLHRIRTKLGTDFIKTIPELGYKVNL